MTRPLTVALRAVIYVLVVVLVAAFIAALIESDPEHVKPDRRERPAAGVSIGPFPIAITGADPEATNQLVAEVEAINAYLEAVERDRIEKEWLALEEAERLRAAARPRISSMAPTGSPTPAAAPSSCAYADAIRAAWAGTGDEEWAVATAWRESRCDPGARNPSGASGLFQMMMPLHARLIEAVCGDSTLVFDAGCNIAAARALYAGSGRGPWS